MSMRPIDLQSIVSGVKEAEKVQSAHAVKQQQQAHDFEVNMKRREHEGPKTVHEVAKGEAARVVERKREGEKEERRRRERASGKEEKVAAGPDERCGEGRGGVVYNGKGRMHPLVEGEDPHDLII